MIRGDRGTVEGETGAQSHTSETGYADSKGDSSVVTGCLSATYEQMKSSSLKTLGLNGCALVSPI